MQTEEEKISRIAEKVALRIVKIYGSGGGGTSSAIESWVSENFLSIKFFNKLFQAYGPGETEDDPDIEILPNDTQSTISNIKAMFGFWTEQYVSALGQNPDGGGGSVVLNACLASINASALGVPTGVNTGLIFNGNTWVYREMNDINMSAVWQALGASTSEQINASHLTDVLVNYASAGDVATLQGYFTNGSANSALEADTLSIARTIWGQSFDGSANITGNMTGVTNIDALLYFDTTNSRIGVIQQSPAYTLDMTGTMRLTGLLNANGGVTIPSGQSLTIGDAVITWDANADGIKITKGLYSETFISALGAGSTGSGGVDMTTVWQALGASTSEQINISHLTGALSTYATQSWVLQQISGGSGDYLPLSGGTMAGDIVMGTNNFIYGTNETGGAMMFFDGNRTVIGSRGSSTTQATHLRSVTGHLTVGTTNTASYTIWDSGNLPHRELIVGNSSYTFAGETSTELNLDNVYSRVSLYKSAGGTSSSAVDLNSITTPGTYHGNGSYYYIGDPSVALPSTSYFRLEVSVSRGGGSGTYLRQRLQYYGSSVARERRSTNDGTSWTDFVVVQGNIENLLDITVSQTANYVLAAPNGSAGAPTFRHLVPADIYTNSATGDITNDNTEFFASYQSDTGFDNTTYGNRIYRRPVSALWAYMKRKITADTTLSVASATTASKLSTVSKKAWGKTYWTSDGIPTTISGDMSSVGNISFSASGKNIGGFLYFDTTNSRLGVGASSPSYKLHVSGDIYATGGVTCLSDARKKIDCGDLPVTVENVAEAPAIRFLWKDNRQAGHQAGTFAQYWQKVLPEVITDKSGELSMQYGVAALVSAIITARKVVDHERRIKDLERENERLKSELKQLKAS